MRMEDVSSSLEPGPEGIYVSSGPTEVSYASHGHAGCYGVEDRSFWFRHRNDCIAGMIRNHPPPDRRLLDVGGGNGFVAQRLISEGYDVVLLEPGIEGALNARSKRGLPHVACSRIEDAGFFPGSFGGVGMFDVIEHIDRDREFLEKLRPLLAPGGKLYLTVPCHQWLWSQADVDAGHFRRHTRTSLQSMLDGLFTIDYLSFFFRPLVLPQYLVRALPHRLGLGRKQAMLSTEAEHGTRTRGLTAHAVRIVNAMLAGEARRIAANESIGFGASCLVAATRRDGPD